MNTFSNFYSRVQNAQRAGDPIVTLPWSHKAWRLAVLLKRLKYIEDFEMTPKSNEVVQKSFKKNFPKISLHLIPGGFSHLHQISKPSRRVIRKAKELEPHGRPYGSFIVSTSLGLLSCHEAKTLKVGGELMCEIY